MKIKDEYDIVNQPSHYTAGKFEVIDIIEDKIDAVRFEGFLIGNIIKYTLRYRHKNGIEDLRKAQNYLNRLIKFLQTKEVDEDVVVDQ